MAELPWFIFSPSPVSLIQYAILSWFVARQLLKKINYRRPRKLFSLIDGFFAVAFFVVLGDAFWAGFCALRWVPMFPQATFQIIFSFWRDIVACLLFFLLMPIKALNFSLKVKVGILIMFVSQGLWFMLAPSPAFTDYAFAWRHGYSVAHIISAFFLSHFLMRLPLWYIIISAFKIEDSSILFKKKEQLKSK